jgi:hypothetical protein
MLHGVLKRKQTLLGKEGIGPAFACGLVGHCVCAGYSADEPNKR